MEANPNPNPNAPEIGEALDAFAFEADAFSRLANLWLQQSEGRSAEEAFWLRLPAMLAAMHANHVGLHAGVMTMARGQTHIALLLKDIANNLNRIAAATEQIAGG